VPDPVQSERAARLMELLGLSDDELCATLDADPLELLSGQLDHRPELSILLALLDDVGERASPETLRRWVRAAGPEGRPIDALTRRDFASFEDAVAALADRGFVLRGGSGGAPGASGGAAPGGDAPGRGVPGGPPAGDA
jgi:hypothetical protein